jgi:hypothetical protein
MAMMVADSSRERPTGTDQQVRQQDGLTTRGSRCQAPKSAVGNKTPIVKWHFATGTNGLVLTVVLAKADIFSSAKGYFAVSDPHALPTFEHLFADFAPVCPAATWMRLCRESMSPVRHRSGLSRQHELSGELPAVLGQLYAARPSVHSSDTMVSLSDVHSLHRSA